MITAQLTVVDGDCPRCGQTHVRLIDLIDTRTQSRVEIACEDCVEEVTPPWV